MIKKEIGFTVLELLVSTAIMAIVAYSSVAFFSDLGPSFDRWNANIYALQDLRFAQTLAITEGCRVIVSIAANGKSYSVGCDYLNYDYTSPYVADSLFLNRSLPATTTLTSDATIIFNAKGQCITANGDLTSRALSLSSTTSGTFLTATILPTGVVVES